MFVNTINSYIPVIIQNAKISKPWGEQILGIKLKV